MRARTLLLPALCATSFALKLWVNAERTSPGHGDVAYYTTLARNLAAGRGFVIDYVPEFLSNPPGIPNPANTYWMPFVSLVAAVGMWIGGPGFVAGQVAVAAFTALMPLVTYALTLELFRCRKAAIGAAVLAVSFHLFLAPGSSPVTHGPVGVLGGATLWAILRSREDLRFLPLVGFGIALAHLNRSDAVVFFPVVLAAHLFRPARSARRPFPWKGMAALGLAYAVTMSPLWWHTWSVTGRPLPTGLSRTAFLVHYQELYSLPERLTPEHYLEGGWGPVIAQKLRALRENADTFFLGMARSVGDHTPSPIERPGLYALVLLAWAGLVARLRRGALPVLLLAAGWFALYTLIFSATGLASLTAAMFALYPVALGGASVGLLALARRAPQRAALGQVVLVGLFGALCVSNVLYARERIETGAHWIERKRREHKVLLRDVIEPRGLEDATFLAAGVHQLHADTGLRLVSLPFEDEPVIRAVAERFGAEYVLFTERPRPSEFWSAPHEITRHPEYEQVFAGPVQGRPMAIYRIPPVSR